jgi:aryl-alcohol dehydrogenase-like predicted oxidoreductase
MTHIAMQEVDDEGSPVTWGQHVTNAEYNGAPASTPGKQDHDDRIRIIHGALDARLNFIDAADTVALRH